MEKRLELTAPVRMFAASAILAASPVLAQTFFGSVVGTVTDPLAASIAHARVTLTNAGTNEVKSAMSDQSGNYRFLDLIPGTYKLDVEMAGFRHSTKDEIRVLVQASVRVDVQMEVGDIGQTVEVSAQTLALQTETARSAKQSRAGTSRTCH